MHYLGWGEAQCSLPVVGVTGKCCECRKVCL